MKLWLLKPMDDLINDPWKPWFDKMFGFVIRTETAEEARQIAQEYAGDEKYKNDALVPWLDPKFSTCVELLPEGEPGLILNDFHAA